MNTGNDHIKNDPDLVRTPEAIFRLSEVVYIKRTREGATVHLKNGDVFYLGSQSVEALSFGSEK